jgi:Subtilase family
MADERALSQVNLMISALPDLPEVWPQAWEQAGNEMVYVCRPRTVLVREADVERVAAALPEALGRALRRDGAQARPEVSATGDGLSAERGRPAGGVVPLNWTGIPGDDDRLRVSVVLDELDILVGAGVARPEHVVYVCPGYACPAHEPLEVAAGTTLPTHAFPSPGRGFCSTPKSGGGKGIKISIVDTGLYRPAESAHSWMAGVVGAEDGGADGATIAPYGGHGTFGAGCARIAAPGADIFVASALPYAGADYEMNLVAAIDQMLDDGIPDVLVFTFASYTRNGKGMHAFDDLYDRRLRHLKGLALLAPAGNDYGTRPMWPAAYPWVTSVGALDANCDQLADYSNRGPWVDVSGPGTDLVNAFPDGAYQCTESGNNNELRTFTGMARWSGTSFSTPTVAGMVAARASTTGVSAAVALEQLLTEARSHSIHGVGPVLVPGYRPCGSGGCGCGGCGCGCSGGGCC